MGPPVAMADHQPALDRPLPFPPDPHQQGAHGGPQQAGLYSDKLKTNVTWDNRLKRNVLEITLEKEEDNFVDLGAEAIARLFKTLGINISQDVEGYFQRSKSIHVWLSNGINLDRFCKNESIRVTKTIKTGFIRPAGKKEVTVTVSGLDFNTPDTFVMEYIGTFGTVITNSVIYDRYKDGAFKGKYNGDRKYQVDFTKTGASMGTFHIIDGSRVRVYYPGNKKTCGRCHQSADKCKGDAVAKNCEENGGTKVELQDHMRNLWNKTGFQPHSFQLDLGENATQSTNDATIKNTTKFSPVIARPEPTEDDKSKYDGVCLKNFPKEAKKTEVINFLKSKGLPEELSDDNIAFGTHGNVEIRRIPSQICQDLIDNIHFVATRQTFFGKPIYCRAVRALTPEKLLEAPSPSKEVAKQDEAAAALTVKEVSDEEVSVGEVVGEEEDNDWEFEDEQSFVIDKVNSKLFGDNSELSEDSDTPNPAMMFLKDPNKSAAVSIKNKKQKTRQTPTSASAKKIEKKTKTQ